MGAARRCAGGAALGLLAAFFLVLKAFAVPPHPSDEGIYFYGAARIAGGAVPYRDFFFAHPPLHVLAPALLFKLAGGYSFAAAKAVPFAMATLQGICVWQCVRRLMCDPPRWLGEACGIAAAAALLFSESFLKASSSATGINQAGGFLALSATLLVARRPAAAGAMAGCAVMTLLQAAPVTAVLAAVAGLRLGWRSAALRYVVGAGAIVLAFHALFLALAGKAFVDQVYFYHLAKVASPGEGARQLGFIVVDNWALFAAGGAAIAALIAAGGLARAVGAWAVAAAAVQLVAMATRPRVFPFYFQPAFFPIALGLGCGLSVVIRGVLRWKSDYSPTLSRANALGIAGVGLALVTFLERPLAAVVSPRRAEQRETYSQTYTWMDAPGIGPLNGLVRAVFWRDGTRRTDHDYGAITQYLWQRSRWLDTHRALVHAVELLAATTPGATLFGDSTTAPLVALDAGLRVTGDFVDTNKERFRSGVAHLSEVAALLDGHPTAILMLSPRDGIGSLPEMQAYVDRHYTVAARFESRIGHTHVLYRRQPFALSR